MPKESENYRNRRYLTADELRCLLKLQFEDSSQLTLLDDRQLDSSLGSLWSRAQPFELDPLNRSRHRAAHKTV